MKSKSKSCKEVILVGNWMVNLSILGFITAIWLARFSLPVKILCTSIILFILGYAISAYAKSLK